MEVDESQEVEATVFQIMDRVPTNAANALKDLQVKLEEGKLDQLVAAAEKMVSRLHLFSPLSFHPLMRGRFRSPMSLRILVEVSSLLPLPTISS